MTPQLYLVAIALLLAPVGSGADDAVDAFMKGYNSTQPAARQSERARLEFEERELEIQRKKLELQQEQIRLRNMQGNHDFAHFESSSASTTAKPRTDVDRELCLTSYFFVEGGEDVRRQINSGKHVSFLRGDAIKAWLRRLPPDEFMSAGDSCIDKATLERVSTLLQRYMATLQ